MGYDSDFYTTRRYASRPIVSSYSVTSTPTIRFGVPRIQTYTTTYPIYSTYPTIVHRSIPFVAHKRIVTGTRISTSPTPTRIIRSPSRVITSPIRVVSCRLRPSQLNRELQRIENQVRFHPHFYATEHYLNSDDYKDFDDETRDIRVASRQLLRKIQTTEKAQPVSYIAKYEKRWGPTSYVENLLAPIRGFKREVSAEPIKFSGKSHLASIRIVGDKAYPTRIPLAHAPFASGYGPSRKVMNDINLRSYYALARKDAANRKSPPRKLASAKLDPHRASRKFTEQKPLEDPLIELKAKQAARSERLVSSTNVDDIELEKKKAQRLEAAKLIEQNAVKEQSKRKADEAQRIEETARKIEQAKKDELAAKVAAEKSAAEERERKLAAEAKKDAEAAEAIRLAEEAAAKKAADDAAEVARLAEQARAAEEARLAEEARVAEQARLAEEARLAEQARLAEEQRLAEEAKKAEEQRLADEQRQREEELTRLAEIEKLAAEEQEAELARQAAELVEIARQQEIERETEAAEAAAAVAAVAAASAATEEPIVQSPSADHMSPQIQSDNEEIIDAQDVVVIPAASADEDDESPKTPIRTDNEETTEGESTGAEEDDE